jgi:hypothetical protein
MAKFALQLDAFAKKAGRNADQVVRKVGLQIATGIVMRTPVDTGRARSTWNTSIGSADYKVTESFDKAGAASIAKAAATLSGFKCGPSIWISNGLPYIGRLEQGWSKQAPAGMVAVTVREFQGLVRKAATEVRR